MRLALAWGATLAWGAAALVATPAAVWLRLRGGRLDAGALALGGFLVAQVAALWGALGPAEGPAPAPGPWVGVPAWLGWSLGVSGLAALAAAPRQDATADRAAALAFGLFGSGHLLRELARVAGAWPG